VIVLLLFALSNYVSDIFGDLDPFALLIEAGLFIKVCKNFELFWIYNGDN